ncbi:RES family NAD+ phosphorylase [Sulfurirhabdus autotrophica]|uniref:RES domain-containing protein n=1 Tax=Sulfurirhabdus autotrophica TaxID=1706046 RepID=A0A4R3XV13_9PROT|nr:RES family NAD+ phosphorylase [Sulfurirhabdus autotrophica]TCV81224.1 RES domain-containing protein [Sulfurirhabdus autotrophica]
MADWKACLAAANPVRLSGSLLRLVESQEQVATYQLVSSLDRQAALEEMLEATKPPLRKHSEKLHYLLATPFRYPPLRHGSRFGSRNEPSLFYGSRETRTVLAEAAYYRFVFWFGMTIPPSGKLDTQHTLFEAKYQTDKGVKLQMAPFAAYQSELTHPEAYQASQQLGSLMREEGIQGFEFVSARDPEGGINVALFTPEALPKKTPVSQEPWLCELTGEHVKFYALHDSGIHEFPIEIYLVDGKLPEPA